MAASTSRQSQDILLPPTPAASPKKSSKRKGKEREEVKDQDGLEHHAQPSTSEISHESLSWSWLSLTDSAPSHVPPVFTKDGNYFFSVVGSSIKIYSAVTGEIVSTLSSAHPYRADPKTMPPNWEPPSSSDLITSAVLNPHNPFQLITSSLNGCIMVWDFLDAILLQVVDLQQPITHLSAHDKFKDSVFVGANKVKNKSAVTGEEWAMLLRVSLKPTPQTVSSRVQKSSDVAFLGRTRSLTGMAVSASGLWLVATGGHTAYVASASTTKSGLTKYVSPERLTCLTCHPSDDYFATGDDKGNIRLWYCLNERTLAAAKISAEKRAQTTAFHWHAHAVSSLAFTSNGAYLLSGGEEAVLVIWQLHTGKKEFVPRMGAPIKTLAVLKATACEEEYLLGLADATYVFVNSGTLKITRSFARIKLDPIGSMPSTVSIPLAVHSPSATLVLPSSHPSSLQTYSPSSSTLVAELEVSPTNRVSRQDEKPIEPLRVEMTMISSNGDWMATIDSRGGDDSFRGEIYLKMWWWDRKAGFWILKTRIDRPHGLAKVTSVTFSPVESGSPLQLVTTGQDGNIKMWRIRRIKQKGGDIEEYWVARSSFKFRSEIPTHASWSSDGSLLAVSLGPFVALYDPITTALLHLWTARSFASVASAYFLGRSGRYVVVVGSKEVFVWDLVAQSDQCCYKEEHRIQAVVCHALEESFAVFFESTPTLSVTPPSTTVALFRPSSDSPYATYTIPFELVNVAWYRTPWSKATSSSFSLVGITSQWRVMLFGDSVEPPRDEGAKANGIIRGSHATQRRTLFQDIFGVSAFTGLSTAVPSAAPSGLTPARTKDVAGIFNGPAYLMPPLESLFESAIKPFLRARNIGKADDLAATGGEGRGADSFARVQAEDVDMDHDEDELILVTDGSQPVASLPEIEAFVELFKMTAIKSTEPSSLVPGPGQTNGAHRRMKSDVNHEVLKVPAPAAEAKMNGDIPHPSTSLSSLDLVSSPAASSSSPPPTLSAGNRKRKKPFN